MQRFGRNKKRRLRELEELLQYHDLNMEVIGIMRQTAEEGLGVQCTFVDDNMTYMVALAQRAVLAGLIDDASPGTKQRLLTTVEPTRANHETALGRKIDKAASRD